MRIRFAICATLLAASAGAQQQYCHDPSGACWAHPHPIGLSCRPENLSLIPCPVVTPTPLPTATPTPTMPIPVSYTITPFLKGSDLGYSYLQWMSMMNGVIWGNGGQCCPGIGDGIGECIFAVDYNTSPPTHKELWCTYRDSTRLWESASVQVASSDTFKWVVAGVNTYRPPVTALQEGFKAGEIWGFGSNEIAGPGWQKARGAGTIAHMANWLMFPQGILDLGGVRWIYASVLVKDSPGLMIRFYWPDAWRIAFWDPSTILAASGPGGSGIVIDADGSLVTADSDWSGGNIYTGKTVKIWRSTDEGRTWKDTGLKFDARPGKTLFGCGWSHKSGGAAQIPWVLICTEGTGKGPDAIPSDWNAVAVRVGGATIPPNFGQKPAFKP